MFEDYLAPKRLSYGVFLFSSSSMTTHGMRDRRRSFRRSKSYSRRRANRRRLIALVLIVVIAGLLLWFGSYLYNYQIEFYEPRDVERQEVR